jgi:ATP-binding cassette subfamily C (CFTR/MRP) protein 1
LLFQDPTIFSGSIRQNLDPFGEHDDTALWDALARAQMKEAIEALPQMLEMDVGEGGESFSVGQRQLVSLPITARPHNEYINILCSYRSITML